MLTDKNLQWKAYTSSCIGKRVLYFGKAVFPKQLPGGSSAKSQSSFCQCGYSIVESTDYFFHFYLNASFFQLGYPSIVLLIIMVIMRDAGI